MIQGLSGFGRSASASALHSKNLKGNPLKNQFGDSAQKNSQPLENYTASEDILKNYVYGSGKKRDKQVLEYSLPNTFRGSII